MVVMATAAEQGLRISGARVVCPLSGVDEVRDLHVRDGLVCADAGPEARVLDGRGLAILPGFVDLSAHLGDPGYLWRETLETGSLSGAAGGFTTVVASPDTDPVVDRGPLLANLVQRAATVSGARVRFAGALTERLAGEDLAEIGCMVDAGAAVISDGGRAMADTLVLRRALEYAQPFGVPVVLRPAEPDLEMDGVVHEGPVALRIGLRGLPSASEEMGTGRAVALARLTGARVHLHGVSTAQAVRQVRMAREQGLNVTCSIPARNLLLTDEEVERSQYNTALRLLPPLRTEADRQALVEAVRDGTAMVTAAHFPLSRVEKEHEFERSAPGGAGLESAFAATFTALEGDLKLVAEALGTRAAVVLGDSGALRVGCRADFVVVDPGAENHIDTPQHSMGVNEPLAGQVLRGAVKATMVAGRWAFNTLLS
jgi:dihydroorotase